MLGIGLPRWTKCSPAPLEPRGWGNLHGDRECRYKAACGVDTRRNTQASALAAEPGLGLPGLASRVGVPGVLEPGLLAFVHSCPCISCPLSCPDSIAGFGLPPPPVVSSPGPSLGVSSASLCSQTAPA